MLLCLPCPTPPPSHPTPQRAILPTPNPLPHHLPTPTIAYLPQFAYSSSHPNPHPHHSLPSCWLLLPCHSPISAYYLCDSVSGSSSIPVRFGRSALTFGRWTCWGWVCLPHACLTTTWRLPAHTTSLGVLLSPSALNGQWVFFSIDRLENFNMSILEYGLCWTTKRLLMMISLRWAVLGV